MKNPFFSHNPMVSVFVMVFVGMPFLIPAQQPSVMKAWQEGESYTAQVGAMLGASVAVGDINGDGLEDIVAGAPLYDGMGDTPDVGLCRCVFGNQAFLVIPVSEVVLRSPMPQAVAKFCLKVATGDINGDGFQDIVVGEPKFNLGGQREVGRVHVYFGSANFVGGTPAITIENPEPSVDALFGIAITTGDLNRDGFDDLAIGAPLVNGQEGRVYYYQGGAALSPRPTLTLRDPQPEMMARFGITLAAGDVTGDGADDLLVGAPFSTAQGLTSAGQVFVFFGGMSFNAVADATLEDPQTELGALFGQGLAVGDVNGDRIGDLIVGAPDSDVRDRDLAADAGQSFVFFGGSPLDLAADAVLQFGSGLTNVRLLGSAHLGAPVVAGDFNGDKIDDVVAAAVGLEVTGRDQAGQVFVFYGGPAMAGARGSIVFPDFVFQNDPAQAFGQLGRALATGDINGDLVEDIVFGSPFFDTGTFTTPLRDTGEIFIALGFTPILTKQSE